MFILLLKMFSIDFITEHAKSEYGKFRVCFSDEPYILRWKSFVVFDYKLLGRFEKTVVKN